VKQAPQPIVVSTSEAFSAATVRTGAKDDLPALKFVDPLLRADPDRAQLVRDALRDGQCVVATDGDDIVGYAIVNDGFLYEGFVPLLMVAISSRRCGVATRLLGELERRCAKQRLFVPVGASNVPAQCLLEKCGYAPSGHTHVNDAGESENVYFKHLKPRR